jgi:glycosyltransferase involved in cell wall biosynthesis
MFFVPGENGVRSSFVEDRRTAQAPRDKKLELVFAGRLVPYKACDLALRGAAPLLRAGRAYLTILGDGPERPRFEALADELRIRGAVTFCGMVSHSEVLARFREADVLVFPSLREFGGGVVFEALAKGAVPVVADHGGPGDIVRDDVGYRIRLSNERQMAEEIGVVLEHLAWDRNHLEILRQNGQAYAREELTWERKAQMITEILLWATGAGPKPRKDPPKFL